MVEKLYVKLRQDIVECVLTPGKSFSEAELGREYKASRTPVREVCRRLENEGLIRITPFRGYCIAPLTVSEFHDLEELQLVFEPSTAAMAAERATNAQIETMQVLASYEYQMGNKQSYRRFVQSNHQLHSLIAQSTGNKQLQVIVNTIHVRLMRFFYLGLSLDSYGPVLVKEHRGLVEAIRRRKPDEARQKAREHIVNAIERSGSLLTGAIRFGEAVFESPLEFARPYEMKRIMKLTV